MGQILRNWRVLAASLFSVALVVGAYLFARGVEHPPVAQASTETALLSSIASKDTDNDGLPDWEESLYGTSPTNPDTFNLGMTDGEAVAKGLIVPKAVADVAVATSTARAGAVIDPSLPPAPADGTLTDAFAKNFFTLYLDAKQQNSGAALTTDQLNGIAQQALSNLAQAVSLAPDFKSMSNLSVSGTGPDAMKTFAEAAGTVLASNSSGATKSEIEYLKDAVQNGDTSALTQIAGIAKDYRRAAAGLAVLPVPQELAQPDLDLINSFARLSEIVQDFTSVNSDPLAAMLALQQYPGAVLKFGNAFISFSKAYQTAGITLPAGSPGAAFIGLIPDIAAEQAASSTTP